MPEQASTQAFTHWRKSSYSGPHGQDCVEVADTAIRDSKHPDAGHLTFPTTEWGAFLGAVRHDEL